MLYYLALVILLMVASMAVVFAVRAYANGTNPLDAAKALLAPKPDRRLGVLEIASVDSRRRLILIRRDDVEHLVMTGGPVDLVIETGIKEPVAERASGDR